MRRILITLPVMFLALLLSAPAALATSPHFITASASGPDNNGNLTVNFKESGLGDNVSITYTATADGTAVYACINGGGNHPKAANKETVSGPVSATGTFSSGKNGTISQSLALPPPGPGNFACPPGQRLVLASDSFTNVAITDTTNSVTQSIPGTFSRVFVQL